jgi:hypothetical protein
MNTGAARNATRRALAANQAHGLAGAAHTSAVGISCKLTLEGRGPEPMLPSRSGNPKKLTAQRTWSARRRHRATTRNCNIRRGQHALAATCSRRLVDADGSLLPA